MKVAIVDKYDKKTNYKKYLPNVEFDVYHLSEQNKKKLLVADIDLTKDIAEDYDFLVLVGAEATKYFTKASVVSHLGYLVDEKYIPLIDPGMLVFKPEMKAAFEKAVSNIVEYIEGTKKVPVQRICRGLVHEDEIATVLEEILALSSRPVAIDTETTCLYPRDGYVLGISIAASITEGFYISSDGIDDYCTELLQKIIDKHQTIFQNGKFDMGMLEYHFRLDFKNKDVTNADTFEDTLLLHYILDETTGSHALKDLAIKYTDLGDYDKDLTVFKRKYCKDHKIKVGQFTYDLIPFDIMVPYACLDAMATLELFNKFYPLVKGSRLNEPYKMVKKGIKLLMQIQDNGVPFDKSKLDRAQVVLSDEIFQLEQEIYKVPEISIVEKDLGVIFNPNSVVHLRYLFTEVLNLNHPGKKTATGALSVDAEVLDTLSKQHPIAAQIKKIKQARKIKSTYIDKILIGIDRDCKLRTNFNLTTTTSGRLSSSGKLNMQQLPRDNKIVKACIRAPEGWKIVSQDLGTAEMYVAAVLSGDKNLMQVFKDKQAGIGADFHSSIAHMVFRLPCDVKDVKEKFPEYRQAAKAISFGILFGSGPDKVAETVQEAGNKSYTKEDAINDIQKYFASFPRLEKWLKNNQQAIKRDGFIYSIYNRKRRLGNVFSSDRQTSSHEVRSGINFLIQSVASDINLLASIEIQDYINKNNLDVKLFGLVHDSILALVKDEDLAEYLDVAGRLTQQDLGCMIPGCPIAIDQEVGQDYSFVENYAF